MTRPEIETKVRQIIADQTGYVGPTEIKLTDSIIDPERGLDSLDSVEIIMAVEEDFEIEITDEEAEKLKTVGDLVGHIEGKLAA